MEACEDGSVQMRLVSILGLECGKTLESVEGISLNLLDLG